MEMANKNMVLKWIVKKEWEKGHKKDDSSVYRTTGYRNQLGDFQKVILVKIC